MRVRTGFFTAGFLAVALAGPGSAGGQPADSFFKYDMPNGNGVASGGTWNYWDAIYTGSGNRTQDGAPLSGGFGKLVDGVVAQDPWHLASDLLGLGPHVGWWLGATSNPTIAFNWPVPTCPCTAFLDSITLWVDNTRVGGVGAPVAMSMDGVPLSFTPPAPGSFGAVHVDGLDMRNPLGRLQLFQDPAFPWMMISEVELGMRFVVHGIPEPGSLALTAVGFAALAGLRRSRRR
jgi:hypothetical protein